MQDVTKQLIGKFILVSSFLIIVSLLVFSIKGSEKDKIPEIPKEQKLELRNKILEASNLDYQIQDLSKKREQLINEVNKEINDIFTKYKIDKNNYTLDIQNIAFVPIKK